jgi:curved DNA-binding protein CbpA
MELGRAYAILGVDAHASPDDLRRAYRSGLRRHHPDTGDGDPVALAKVGRAYRAIAGRRPAADESPVNRHARPVVDVYA